MTNQILDDLVEAVAPRRMTVTTDWLVRGGIHTWWRPPTPREGLPPPGPYPGTVTTTDPGAESDTGAGTHRPIGHGRSTSGPTGVR